MLPQTVRMVHAAFDALMDVLEAQQALAERRRAAPDPAAAAAAAASGAGESAVAFQEATALELMSLGALHAFLSLSSMSACVSHPLCRRDL